MTITPLSAVPFGRAGLVEKLLAAVRPEFHVDVLVPDPDDPVLGWKRCPVPDCNRAAHEKGMCTGHAQRWRRVGSPDIAVFLTDPGPRLRGVAELTHCTVSGCRFGAAGKGLCSRHRDKWSRSGSTDPATWAASAPPLPGADRTECALPTCTLWVENRANAFCKSHHVRWRQDGDPPVEDFITECQSFGLPRVDFRGLAPQLKLEFQHAVQARRDAQTVTAPARLVAAAIRRAQDERVTSLLDYSAERWHRVGDPYQRPSGSGGYGKRVEAFLLFARDAVETLRDGAGWEVEYARDVWRLGKLNGLNRSASRPRPRSELRFDRLAQPWLRTLAKRWIRLRLSSGLNVSTVTGDMQALTRFSEFVTVVGPAVRGLSDVDRPLLERYLAWLTDLPGGLSSNESRVNGLHLFFQGIRQHGWDHSLPTGAAFYTGDCPRRRSRLARHLAEHIMTQVEQPANLDQWTDSSARLITLILVRCGLRVSDACTIRFDCLLHDGQRAPYLRYFNNKMSREAAVPIDEEIEAEIRSQQQRVLERWPDGNPHLFPRLKGNAGGNHHFSPDTYRQMLKRWLTQCDVRDENGLPVHLTPHQWRHTFATRLINRDVPQEVVRVLLDHDSHQMTAHYARITDQTVRRRWEAATKVNIQGERVALGPDGPLAQAEWAKTRYGIATQTLPNGYCGLPVQKTCPHANACLTCPVFVTGPEFLPELQAQRGRTLTLIDNAKGCGHQRVAEMNEQVLINLDRMIGELDADGEAPEAADAG
ncbi:tyrosine-type recombinase/integrase [Streptomyces sp. MBT27]|uniref:tyrosine-type recombinase/integrase n=1 Tax=Streptomyces sp. MBT27 TaxID=1488356 RepID=UPI001F072349|nr:tyrosine-type recombinase/integrase [Streptomyces sp. MBT27]